MIPEWELDLIRTERGKTLPSKFTVRRKERITPDGVAPANIASEVPGRVKPGFGFFRSLADKHQTINAHNVTLAWDADLSVNDELIDEDTGAVYKVRDVKNSSYNLGTVLLADKISD